MRAPDMPTLPAKDYRLHIAIPADDKRRTHEAAVARGLTVAEFARRALLAAVNDNSTNPQQAA